MTERRRTRVVGRPYAKVDAAAKVTGQTRFADDIVLPRMLHCKLLRAKVAHARIVRIDAAKALARPGVVAVATGRDLPIPFGILPVSQDEHALCSDRVRFVGDPVAAVAAVDEDAAVRRARGDRGRIREAAAGRFDRRRASGCGDSHPRLRGRGQHPQARRDGVRRHRGGLRARGPRLRGPLLLRGEHAPAARAARRGRRLRARRQAHPLVVDPDAALRPPGPGEGARDARGEDPRHRDTQRRRLRRQVRSRSTTRSSSRTSPARRGGPSRSA